jgi:hypothetical protein
MGRSEDDREVQQAKEEVTRTGPVPVILEAQHPEGYWTRPGGGYSPSYRATVWQIIFLAELGADPSDERVRRGCEYLLNHNVAANGGFSMAARPVPSSVVHTASMATHCTLCYGWAMETTRALTARSAGKSKPSLAGEKYASTSLARPVRALPVPIT